MDQAKIVAEGSPQELIRQWSTPEVLELRFAVGVAETLDGQLADLVPRLAERVEVLPDRILVYTANGENVAEEVHRRGFRPVSTLVRRSTLEDVFLRLTGRSLVET
jgi:lipooligosaccharide transport system ATP-binding protein